VPFGTAKLWLWPDAQKRRPRTDSVPKRPARSLSEPIVAAAEPPSETVFATQRHSTAIVVEPRGGSSPLIRITRFSRIWEHKGNQRLIPAAVTALEVAFVSALAALAAVILAPAFSLANRMPNARPRAAPRA
jgi:hypothetical protein